MYTQMTRTAEQLVEFMSGTLLGVQETLLCQEKSLRELTQESLVVLKQKGLIYTSETPQQTELHITRLGKATYKGTGVVI